MDGAGGEVQRVSDEIETLRSELGGLVSELDRRRHELLDVRLQLRRHPGVVLAAAGAAALLLGGAVAVAVRNRRRRSRPAVRAQEARRALARLLEHPHRVATEPSMGVRIATAVGVAAGSAVARRVAERLVTRALPRR
jgi:hypothetical protein